MMSAVVDSIAAPHSRQLLSGIAEQLSELATESEQFGLVLCSDAAVAGRYLVQLQQIDRLAQSLRELANVLAAPSPDAAVAGIRLGDLRLALGEVDAF
jgi:ABC-type transporter Mla subunit MlaD